MICPEKGSESINSIFSKVCGTELKELIRRAEYVERLLDMEGIFGLEELTEEGIQEIVRTGDIFACCEKVKPKKEKTIIPKPKRIIPRKMTYWELMDYLEYVMEFEQGG